MSEVAKMTSLKEVQRQLVDEIVKSLTEDSDQWYFEGTRNRILKKNSSFSIYVDPEESWFWQRSSFMNNHYGIRKELNEINLISKKDRKRLFKAVYQFVKKKHYDHRLYINKKALESFLRGF
jgi:hypothetical protein